MAKDSTPIMTILRRLSHIEIAYHSILKLVIDACQIPSEHCHIDSQQQLTHDNPAYFLHVLSAVSKRCGVEALYNGIIEMSRRVDSPKQIIDSYGLKVAFCNLVLCVSAKDRFASLSRDFRYLVKEFVKSASPQNLLILEGIWREAIVDWVMEESSVLVGNFQKVNNSSSASANPSSQLADKLIVMLRHARDVCKLDVRISPTVSSGLIADVAFMIAYRRMPKEVSFVLTKALAVCISFLVDAQKQIVFDPKILAKVDATCDLIQVE